MRGTTEAQVHQQVQQWLAWLQRWRPATHRGRSRPCVRCARSPLLAAAGLETDVPHAVQHALVMRMRSIIDHAVDDYTEQNLPLLWREVVLAEERKAKRPYRPTEGLDLEYCGLALDPEPEPGQPFLFTLERLAEDTAAEAVLPPPAPFTDEEKVALRREVQLADDHARSVGREVCAILNAEQGRLRNAINAHVEPHLAELFADLERELSSPGFWA